MDKLLMELNQNIIEIRNDIIIMKNEIHSVKNDIELIKKNLDIITPQTQRMDDHVEFVNKVYAKIKKPFHFVFDNISYLIGNSPRPLTITDIELKPAIDL